MSDCFLYHLCRRDYRGPTLQPRPLAASLPLCLQEDSALGGWIGFPRPEGQTQVEGAELLPARHPVPPFLRFIQNLLWLLGPALGLWRHLFGMQKCTSSSENLAVAEGACLILINTIAVKEDGFELPLCVGNRLNPGESLWGLLCTESPTL